eukprot:2573897-Rhodomonas_salina.1
MNGSIKGSRNAPIDSSMSSILGRIALIHGSSEGNKPVGVAALACADPREAPSGFGEQQRLVALRDVSECPGACEQQLSAFSF